MPDSNMVVLFYISCIVKYSPFLSIRSNSKLFQITWSMIFGDKQHIFLAFNLSSMLVSDPSGYSDHKPLYPSDFDNISTNFDHQTVSIHFKFSWRIEEYVTNSFIAGDSSDDL